MKVLNKYFGRNDILLIAAVFAAIIIFFLYRVLSHDGAPAVAEIKCDGSLIGEYDLTEDRKIPIEDESGEVMNLVMIEDSKVYMKEASCPDSLCIRQGKIYRSGQTIVCLPHRVVITIKGSDEGEIDSISN